MSVFERARVLRAVGPHILLDSTQGEVETLSLEPLLPGDWVDWDPVSGRVIGALPRRGVIARKGAGRSTSAQPIAANVDVVLIVQGLDSDFNLRRLERYLLLAAACETRAAVVLTKADLLDSTEAEQLAFLARERTGARVVAVSAVANIGLDALDALVSPGETAVLLGSSGAGKSTLVNALLGGDRQRTGETRVSDGRGRHTTTAREVFRLPSGWLLIDTPGLREVEAWAAGDAVDDVFDDISETAGGCRFRDCRHQGEPGCAVRRAVDEGEIDADRLDNYLNLSRETSEQESKRQARICSKAIKRYNRFHRRP